MIYRVLVSGARDWPERLESFVHMKIMAAARPDPGGTDVHVLEGECPAGGVDLYARRCAYQAGFRLRPYPADWKGLGKRAGNLRNTTMVEVVAHGIARGEGGVCLAFPTPASRGTVDCYRKAVEAGIETHIFPLAVAERWADRG